MDWLSLVLLVFVGLMAVAGLRKGLVRQILSLVGLVASVMLALQYYGCGQQSISFSILPSLKELPLSLGLRQSVSVWQR